MNLSIDQITKFKEMWLSFWTEYWLPLLTALLVLRIWLKVIKWVTKIVNKWLTKWNIDITIAKFATNLVSFALKCLLVITVAWMVGIETTSFVAIIWAAWLAVWLALQWSLSNFAWWVLILLFKPYQVWDVIELDWELWKVDEIDILITRLLTWDNRVVIIPNWQAANSKIINRSQHGPMRVEVPVWIWYGADIDHAKKVLVSVVSSNSLIKDSPTPDVVVAELWDSSVNLLVRGYCDALDYPAAYGQIMEWAKKALDKENIDIPFPHRVVHTVNT